MSDPDDPVDPGRDAPSSVHGPAEAVHGPLVLALRRIRADPALLVPFLVAGLVLSGLDWLRSRDSLPAATTEPLAGEGLEITVEYAIYPTPATQTTRSAGALVDLHPEYLGWALGLEALALLVVPLAGAITIARAATLRLTTRTIAGYVGFVLGVVIAYRVFAVTFDGRVGFVLGLVLLILVMYLFVRLFATPGFLVDGDPPWTAARRSVSVTAGDGWGLVQLILVFGLAAWLVTAVPHLGAALGGPIAAVHAVSVVTYLESTGELDRVP